MKNNEYLQKYGEKALEVYQRTQRQSQQHSGLPSHHLPKRGSKNKSKSQKNLRVQNSREKHNPLIQQPVFTFQKIGHSKNKNKLLISGMSTPKNKLSKSKNFHEDPKKSSSTKKKRVNDSITGRLEELVGNHKKETKKMVNGALECLQMICQQETKLKEWLGYLKSIVTYLADEVTKYKTKWRTERAKNARMQRQIKQLHENMKANSIKRQNQIVEYPLFGENERLKEKIVKMQQKLKDFERKQMVLISTLEQYNIRKSEKVEYFPQVGHQEHEENESDEYDSSEDECRKII